MAENRRDFLKKMGLITVIGATGSACNTLNNLVSTETKPHKIPLWKGFNLLNKFNPQNQSAFNEKDFEIIAGWGFNFVRLPLSYWTWSSEDDWYSVNEKVLQEIDQAVDFGKRYNLHVNLNFHRLPGYCINNPKPPTNLFEDEVPLLAAEFQWKQFAQRYKGISSKLLSFNLINEAPSVSVEKYDKVARRLIRAIRDEDPERLIFVDGKDVGRTPLMTLTDVPNIVQSGRGYDPMLISHFRATWPNMEQLMSFPEDKLSWPLVANGKRYDRQSIYESSAKPWQPWIAQGGNVHIGEMGCYNKTPHEVALAWLEDVFSVFKEQGWGWSLWNLQGDFGVLNSRRKDVKYENFKGMLLDRKMLELLKRS